MKNRATYEDSYGLASELASNEKVVWEKSESKYREASTTHYYGQINLTEGMEGENIRVLLQCHSGLLDGFLSIMHGPITLFNDHIPRRAANKLAERINYLLAKQKN